MDGNGARGDGGEGFFYHTIVPKGFENQWAEASFLVPKGSFSGDSIYAFVQFNGQSGVQMDIDRIMIFKTGEEVAALGDWELF